MPLLYPACFVYLFVMYWYCKFMFLKYCQRSPCFNEHLVLSSFNFLKLAVLLHLLMAIFMFSNSKMLADYKIDGVAFSTEVTT